MRMAVQGCLALHRSVQRDRNTRQAMNPVDALIMNSPWLGVVAFVLAAVLAALLCYALARMLLGRRIAADTELLAGRVIARLGTLHALILALMFAQEMADFRDIARVLSKEANAIGDVYQALQEYEEDSRTSTAAIREQIVEFVKTVRQVERTAIAEGRLSHRTWMAYQRINRDLRGLQPTNDDQADLHNRMLADWDTVSEFHQRLRAAAEYRSPGIFWVVIIVGFFAIIIPCYVYSPRIANLVMLSTFAAVNGLVMYVILAIQNPFTPPVAFDSTALANLLEMLGSTAFPVL